MPKLLKTPFAIDAAEGFRTDIQESTGAAPNSATYQVGFPPVTMQSIASNGMPPKGSDLNGVLYDITDNLVFLTQGGGYGFDSAYATSIGGYPLNARLRLTNGDIVKSTIDGNTNDPNVDMTGWKKPQVSEIFDALNNSQQDINSQIGTPLLVGADTTGTQDVTAALNLLANPSGLSVMFLTKGDFKTGTVSIPANTICYMNGAKFIRKQYTNTPVIDVGENSLIIGAVVDGNKEILGNSGGLRDYGIRLASGAHALFCVSKNNFKHGITCRSSDAALSVSSNQRVLFCKTENNGFNAGPSGSADGINIANCNGALVFGCDSTGSARTDFVAETYNTITGVTDISLSVGVRFLMCTSDGSAYNSFNCEKVTAPTISNCKGPSSIVFRGSPNAVITNNEVSAISAPEADNPTVLNCKIKNLTSSNEIFYLTGKNPTVENVKVTVDDAVILSNTATVYITNSDGSGSVENVTVNRAYTGVRLHVENAKNIKVSTATNAKVLIARPEKSTIIGDDFKLEKGRLELRTSAVPTGGYFKAGDAVVNSFYGGSIHGWQCTTSGLDAAAIWQQVGIRGLSKMTRIANSSATDVAGLNAKINEILAELLSKNHMS